MSKVEKIEAAIADNQKRLAAEREALELAEREHAAKVIDAASDAPTDTRALGALTTRREKITTLEHGGRLLRARLEYARDLQAQGEHEDRKRQAQAKFDRYQAVMGQIEDLAKNVIPLVREAATLSDDAVGLLPIQVSRGELSACMFGAWQVQRAVQVYLYAVSDGLFKIEQPLASPWELRQNELFTLTARAAENVARVLAQQERQVTAPVEATRE